MKRHIAFIIGASLTVGTVAIASASATPRPPRRPPVTGQPVDPNTTTTAPPSHHEITTTTEAEQPTTTVTEADSELQAAMARSGAATPVPGNPRCGG